MHEFFYKSQKKSHPYDILENNKRKRKLENNLSRKSEG